VRSEPEDRKVNGLRHFLPQSLPHRRVHYPSLGRPRDAAAGCRTSALSRQPRPRRTSNLRAQTPKRTSAGANRRADAEHTASIAKPCKRATNVSFRDSLHSTIRTSKLTKPGGHGVDGRLHVPLGPSGRRPWGRGVHKLSPHAESARFAGRSYKCTPRGDLISSGSSARR